MSDTMYRRFFELKSREIAADGEMPSRRELLASTDAPCDMYGWKEVLVHSDASIDTSSCRSLLLNHDSSMVAGKVGEYRVEGGELYSSYDVMPSARMESGVGVQEAIDFGALRGVSVGYTYNNKDCQIDEETRTVTVNKWRLLEISLTPIPADGTAGIRSFPTDIPKAALAAIPKEARMSEVPDKAAADAAAILTANKERDALALGVKLRDLASEHKIEHGKLDFSKFASFEDGTRAIMAEMSSRSAEPTTPAVRVLVDQHDKIRDAAVNALVGRASGQGRKAGESQWHGRSINEIYRAAASAQGLRSAEWDKRDLAQYVLTGAIPSGERAANVTSSMFSNFVMANVLNKVVAMGWESSPSGINYEEITWRNEVSDFRAFRLGNLSMANLALTVENTSFLELDKAEGYYNGQLGMWGGTVSLTLQALINDDTGVFDRNLRSAGMIARRTINKEVYRKLLLGLAASTVTTADWTGNTTAGSILYSTVDAIYNARTNLGLVQGALMQKVGLDGNPSGWTPSKIIVPTALMASTIGIMGQAPGGASVAAGSLGVIASPWLDAASGLVGASASSYYLIADPSEGAGIAVTFLQGMDTPVVEEYDAGAVAARKWKIYLPFSVDLPNFTPASGSGLIIPGVQRGT